MSKPSIRYMAERFVFEGLFRPLHGFMRPWLYRRFKRDQKRHTNNFGCMKWMGIELLQTPHDAWLIQEAIAELKPSLIIETGTFRGGSAMYYATLMDLMNYDGKIVTVDIGKKHDFTNPRINFLIGSSTDPAIVAQIQAAADAAEGHVMVILDGCHEEEHVYEEMKIYGPMVTVGSFMHVQDGKTDSKGRPKGPLGAIVRYEPDHPEFVVDEERCNRFLITHHPRGWLRKVK